MRIIFLLFNCLFLGTSLLLGQGDLAHLNNEELDHLANHFYHDGNFKKALSHWSKLSDRAQAENLDSFYVSALSNMGKAYEEAGATDKAKTVLLKALQLSKEKFGSEHLSYVVALSNLALLEENSSNYKDAEPHYLEAVEISKRGAGHSRPQYGPCLGALGSFYHTIGKYPKAEALYLQSAEVIKKTLGSEKEDYATVLSNLASLYSQIGRLKEGLTLDLEALKLRKKIWGSKHRYYAMSLGSVAAKYFRLGKVAEAEPLMLEALALEKAIYGTDNSYYAATLGNLSVLYTRKRDFKKALKVNLETLAIKKRVHGEKHPSYAQSVNNLAFTYQHLKDYDNSKLYFQKAATISKSLYGENHLQYARNSYNLATAHQFKKEYDQAEPLFLKTLDIYEQQLGTQNKHYLNVLSNLGSFYSNTGQFEKATKIFNQSLYIICKHKKVPLAGVLSQRTIALDLVDQSNMEFISNHEMVALLHKIFMLSNARYNQSKDISLLKTAYKAIQYAMKINELERNELNGAENKLSTLKTMSTLAFKAIYCANKMSTDIAKDAPNNEFIAHSFSYAEQNKSILLADALQGNQAKIMGNLPEKLALRELALEQEKSNVQKKLAVAKNDAQRNKILSDQNELNLEIDAFLRNLKSNYPKYHAFKYEHIMARAADIQLLLDDKTAMLEYFVSKDITYLFVLTKQHLELLPIDLSRIELNTQVKTLRQSLSDYTFILNNKDKAYDRYINAAHWLYEQLLQGALKDKNIENLIIIADGELGHLPFEAFLVQAANAQSGDYTQLDYLVQNYNISYNYSATLWKNNKEAKNLSTNNQMLACAATYSGLDSTLKALRSPSDYQLRAQLNPLPAAQTEISALQEQFQGRFLFGDRANEAYFKANASQYGIIHLAMHGILDTKVPILSSLAFTENGDTLEDNFLQAYEISHLNMNAQLVVLSACETGYGQFAQGEGVLSLARSFMYAGVPSLVVSLWQVNDHSTSTIMKAFYHYLAAGKTKDVALRLAKLDYIKAAKGIAAHPAFWSPFIQLGDKRSIQLATKKNWLPWAIGVSVCLFFVGGLGIWRNKRKNLA